MEERESLLFAGRHRDFHDLNQGKRKEGRPRKDEKIIVHYVVNAKAVRNEAISLNEKEYQGRFIIASNDLNLDAERNVRKLQEPRVR